MAICNPLWGFLIKFAVMKPFAFIYSVAGIAVFSASAIASNPDLPRVEILGKEYYYHEIKKGESIYGIARKYDWNLEELVRLNPNSASEMKKGSRLYYPTGKVTVVQEAEPQPEVADSVYEPIRHVVKKGETVYSISKKYNVPLEAIYAAYPNAKYGVKAGEILEFQQSPALVNDKYLYYVIKPGDTLFSVAHRYNSSVESILASNPGVSESNFRIGDTVRIKLNSGADKYHTELVEEERIASIDSYKAQKNDTWKSISKKTGVDIETLKEANEDIARPEKNEIINVPVVETVTVEKKISGENSDDFTEDRIQALYDSIHRINPSGASLEEVRVALLLDDPASKKDVDFTRGLLMAVDKLKNSPYKINLKAIDGRASTTTVTETLDSFEPNLLIATADKTFPAFLADYGETNHLEIVNTFDVRNELYEDNPSMVQILPPSSLFNEQVTDHIAENYGKRTVIMVGEKDSNDAIGELLEKKFPEQDIKKVSTESLAEWPLEDGKEYLIYAYPQKKNEISEILGAVTRLKEASPMAEIMIVGRPSWVTNTDLFRDRFNDAEILVPARCWVDLENNEGKEFVEQFTEIYGHAPVKSFPNFAVAGYDIGNFFIETTAKNGGDFNQAVNVEKSGIQTDFDFKRVSNWGGFLNPLSYIVRFRPSGYVEKLVIQ